MRAERELLSPVDAAWFRMDERRDPADIGAVMLFDEPLDEARVRALIEERILVHRRFRARVVDDAPGKLTPPRWEDEPDFLLDAHFRRVRLDGAGDDALAALLSHLMNEPTDFSRSPWTLTMIDGVGAGAALFTRLSHCMGDGFALVDRLLSLADSAEGLAWAGAPHTIATPPDHAHGWMASAAHAGREARDLATALGHLLVLPFDPPTCFRQKVSGERRVAWSEAIPLERVKAVAHARHATVNDVLMAAMAGAYRRYMVDRGEVPTSFRAIVPVNLRPPDEPIDHERGNWFGLVFLGLPVELDTADARLTALKREMDRIKDTKEAVVALGILATLGRSPLVIDHIIEEIFSRKATVVVTNVPGPREHLQLAGVRMRDMWFWSPHPAGLGSGANIISYAGHVRVGIRGDVAVLPDPARLARYYSEEIARWSAAETP